MDPRVTARNLSFANTNENGMEKIETAFSLFSLFETKPLQF